MKRSEMPSARATEPVLLDPLLSRLSGILAMRLGLSFPPERWRDLLRALEAASKELGFADSRSCLEQLVSAPLTIRQMEILASHLTVGETYFFREPAAFSALRDHILPELIRARREAERRIRIWSAGCSTGEEPYSIAITLSRMLPDLKDWNITILATDINPHSLRKASRGVYDDWSFRDVRPGLKEECFSRTKEGRFKIAPHIKALVTFAHLNLVDDVYPSVVNNTAVMDVIFCRNVLMYFEPSHAQAVIEKLCRCLVDGGWLLVSPVEVSMVALPQLVQVRLPDTIGYRKDANLARERKATEQIPSPPVWEPDLSLACPEVSDVEEVLPCGGADLLPTEGDAQVAATPEQTYEEAAANYAQGRYSEAAEMAHALVSRDPDDVKAMALLARAYANQGHLAKAMAWCKKAIAADKLNPAWPYLLASILQEQGRAEEAVKALRRTLYLDQNYVLAHFQLGNLMLRQGRRKESLKHFRNALSILSGYAQDQVLPESEGITAGRLIEIILTALSSEATA